MSEHAVIVSLKPSTPVLELDDLEDSLAAAVASVGEYDGNEIAMDGSEVRLFLYGPDADALFSAVEPVLRSVRPAPGSFAVKRYGEASDPGAPESRVDL